MATPVLLVSDVQRAELLRLSRSMSEPARKVRQARVILTLADSRSIRSTARKFELTAVTVADWRDVTGVIFHSDRGCQFTSAQYHQLCRTSGVRQSMGSTGVCWDNAAAESFFATLKRELIYTQTWPTIREAETAVFEWIEVF